MKCKYIIAAMLVSFFSASAQEGSHALQINLGGGLHTLQYHPTAGERSNGYGGTAEVLYKYCFNQYWGIAVGVGGSSLSSESLYNGQTSYSSVDPFNNLSYEFRVQYNGVVERQNMILVDIPVMATFSTPIANRLNFEVGLGAKLNLPVYTAFSLTAGSIEGRGYFPFTNVEYANLPPYGFDAFSETLSSTVSVKPVGLSLIADLGVSYLLSNSLSLYLAPYVNYGLTNLSKGNTQELFARDLVYVGTLSSNQISKLNLFSVGIKLGLRISNSQKTFYVLKNTLDYPGSRTKQKK